MKNYYKILQVDPSAQTVVIKAAYRSLMLHLKRHPDLGGNTIEAKEINEAYETLKDPILRKQYDKENFFILKYAQKSSQSEYYYARCYFCESINRIKFDSWDGEPKSIKCGKCHSPFFSDSEGIKQIRKYKRKNDRFKCDFDIQVQLKYNGESYTGKCLDISTKGIRFTVNQPVSASQIVKISFNHDKNFQAIAKIVRVTQIKQKDKSIYDCGGLYIEAQYGNPNLIKHYMK